MSELIVAAEQTLLVLFGSPTHGRLKSLIYFIGILIHVRVKLFQDFFHHIYIYDFVSPPVIETMRTFSRRFVIILGYNMIFNIIYDEIIFAIMFWSRNRHTEYIESIQYIRGSTYPAYTQSMLTLYLHNLQPPVKVIIRRIHDIHP